jgi:hypothetical protein
MPAQYRAIWTTPGGGTGYTVLHFLPATNGTFAQNIADDVHDFIADFSTNIPNDVSIQFDSEVLELTDAGVLTAVYPVTPGAQVNGSATGEFARAAGARLDWATDVIVAGRRLSGRTFMVPMAGSIFDTNGLLDSSIVTAFQTAANDFLSATATHKQLAVWSRTHATTAAVTSVSVPPQGAILRGRRD